MVKSGVLQFLGIPYGAPPVGDLRWRPSKPAASWSGVRNSTKFGPICAQITTLGVFAGPVNNNEDCLSLNIFTPKLGTNQKLPVLVWIHGGGHVDGASADYDGSKLAKDGNTVVVTINYRLGLLGYLAHPALDAEGHLFGNYGTTDQQLAMKWVQRNIAAFGGNPNNVTLGGQSAGSTSTGLNVISPLSRGLFDRAIFQSAALLTLPSLDIAETRGTNFAVAAGCGRGKSAAVAACLRSLSAGKIMSLQGTASANGPYVTGLMVDGTILPQQPFTAWQNGRFSRVPVMSGNARDEGAFTVSILEYFSKRPLTAAEYQSYVKTTYVPPAYRPGTADRVLAQYPVSAYASPSLAYVAVGTDAGQACRHRLLDQLLSKWVPVYAYEFRDRTAPYYFPPMSFPVRAAHTIDIQYLFPLWHGGPKGIIHQLNSQQQRLSDQLVDFWTTFARTGNPNGTRNRPWPRYEAKLDNYFIENIPNSTVIAGVSAFAADHHCRFWESTYVF
jgi:para-nitrobenzyl esterase